MKARVIRYHNVSIVDFMGAPDDGGGGDKYSYQTCKAPVKSSTNQHPAFYRPDAFPVTQPTLPEHWRESIKDPKHTWETSNTKGCWLPCWEGCQASRQPSDASSQSVDQHIMTVLDSMAQYCWCSK